MNTLTGVQLTEIQAKYTHVPYSGKRAFDKTSMHSCIHSMGCY